MSPRLAASLAPLPAALAALALLAPAAAASSEVCLRGEAPTLCALDGDGDDLPDDVVLRFPAGLFNDLGMVEVLPTVRLTGDQDRDHLPEVVAAEVLARAQTLEQQPRLRLVATALDGASTAGLGLGTGWTDAALGLDADARGAGLGGGAAAFGLALAALAAGAEPVDADGDGLHDHAAAWAALWLPWDETLSASLAPL